MLKSIYIEGLYGLYTYKLNISRGVFIITGPNGFGKTTILRCLSAIYNGEFWRFYFLKFKNIIVEFVDGYSIELLRTEFATEILYGEDIQETNVKLSFKKNDIEEVFNISRQYINRLVRYQTRRDLDNIEKYLENNYIINEDFGFLNAMPELLNFIRSKRCVVVGTQRLVYGSSESRGSQKSLAYTIDVVNEQIKKIYLDAYNDFSKTAQTIDGSFIKRLSENIDNKDAVDTNISATELQAIIKEYRKYHLIEEMNVDVQLPKSYDLVRNLYLSDIRSKLTSLSKYYSKLSIFDEFVTGKGLSNKVIRLNDNGIEVLSRSGDNIPLNKLSSGEQNLMILAFNLIFKSSKNDILLVDEPENSLHMAWLEGLLDEYIRISKVSNIQVLIATHSPTFIGDRWDMTYDLFENNIS